MRTVMLLHAVINYKGALVTMPQQIPDDNENDNGTKTSSA